MVVGLMNMNQKRLKKNMSPSWKDLLLTLVLASWRVLLGKSALEKAGVFSKVNGLQLLLLDKLPYSMKCLPTILPI